jgi:hypothetical protein
MDTQERERVAAESAALWEDYRRRQNRRVPITFAADENLWLAVAGQTFRAFYTDPRVHLAAQLEGRRYLREQVLDDSPPLDAWPVSVQLWMEENEFYGAQVVYQEDDYAWGLPLALAREDWLPYLANLDPEQRVRQSSAYRMYQALRELTEGLEYYGLRVQVLPPGRSTHGIFTKAAELRGLEQLCLDLVEQPDWAQAYLQALTELTIARIRAWRRLTGDPAPEAPPTEGVTFCDDSLQMLSAASYERFVLPCHQRLYAVMTADGPRGLHLCGHSTQHYPALVRRLGVSCLDGPGPFVDHGYYLQALGPELAFNAQTDHAILLHGSASEVEAMMRGLLSPAAKQPGRFNLLGYLVRATPLANVAACYRAGVAYGEIG